MLMDTNTTHETVFANVTPIEYPTTIPGRL